MRRQYRWCGVWMWAVLGILVCTTGSASAAVRYGVTKIPTDVNAGGYIAGPWVEPMAVNAQGQVVGHVRGWIERWVPDYGGYWEQIEVQHVFTWSPGMTRVHVVDPTGNPRRHSFVSSLNDSGMAVCTRAVSDNPSDGSAPCTWDTATGQFTDLSVPVGLDYGFWPHRINNTGEIVGHGALRSVHWDASGQPTPYFPHDNPNDPKRGKAMDINSLGEMVGYGTFAVAEDRDGNTADGTMDLPFRCNTVTGQVNPLPILYTTNDPNDPMYNAAHRGRALYANDNGIVGGQCNMPRPRTPTESLPAPCYWDANGAIHDLRSALPWDDHHSGYPYIQYGSVTGITDDDTLVIDAYGTSSSTWLYKPGADTDARYFFDLVNPNGQTWYNHRISVVAGNGTMLGQANGADPQGGSLWFNALYLPYDVVETPIAGGAGQQVNLNGGLGTPGGAEVTFADVTAGTVVSHYGQGPVDDFAITFLPDPTDMAAVQANLLAGDAQFWSIDVEDGTYTGPITLTFQYDPALLPPGLNLSDLVMLHHTTNGWETLAPTAVDPINHTVTVQTNSLSPFMLGMVPEPGTAVLLVLALPILLRRRWAW